MKSPLVAAALSVAVIATAATGGEAVFADRLIRAGTILGPGDVVLRDGEVEGAAAAVDDVVGLEARAIIHAGRPVMWTDLSAPTAINRNDIVVLVFRAGGLTITSEGRALGQGSIGDRIQVMNTGSRQTVSGTVVGNGTVLAGTLPTGIGSLRTP